MRVHFAIGRRAVTVEWPEDAARPPLVDGEPVVCDVACVRPGLYGLLVDGRSYEVALEGTAQPGAEVHAAVNGRTVVLEAQDERRRALEALGAARASGGVAAAAVVVSAPMPGRVAAVPVAVGGAVERGQTVVVLEAMKMESAIGAPHAGTVAEVLVTAGQTVQRRQVLAKIAPRP